MAYISLTLISVCLSPFFLQMKCCGVDSYEDFRESKKWTEGNKTVPEACCILEGEVAKFEPKFKNCPYKPSDSNSYWKKVCVYCDYTMFYFKQAKI
jgi:tetraspanin-18